MSYDSWKTTDVVGEANALADLRAEAIERDSTYFSACCDHDVTDEVQGTPTLMDTGMTCPECGQMEQVNTVEPEWAWAEPDCI